MKENKLNLTYESLKKRLNEYRTFRRNLLDMFKQWEFKSNETNETTTTAGTGTTTNIDMNKAEKS